MSLTQLLTRQRLTAALRHRFRLDALQFAFQQPACGSRRCQPSAAAAAAACGRRLRSDGNMHESGRSTGSETWLGGHLLYERRRSRRLGVRAAAAARDKLLNGVDPEFRLEVARVVEAAERAADTWQPEVTDFQPPPVVALAAAAVGQLAGVGCVAWGGYPQAERCRMLVGPEEVLPPSPDPEDADFEPAAALAEAVAAVEVPGNFMFDAASHRDFLGAALGTGIDRSKVGDILVLGDRGAQLLVAPQLADFLCEALTSVRSVTVQPRQIPLSELRVAAPRLERRASVEASMRLDALASAGFRVSRSALTDLIKRGDVRVNWRPAKASAVLKPGDVVSCAGKGRLEIEGVERTAKGKYRVELARRV